VYIAETTRGHFIEFVESVQPPLPRKEKWVLIISTLYGCPAKCLMCDAGTSYSGRISKEDMFNQIDYMIDRRYHGRDIKVKKLKVQFARMGDPAFNISVLEVIEEFDNRYSTPGFIPSISTIAPASSERFFERLLNIKQSKFLTRKFQFQYSIHTTNEFYRKKLIPVKTWSFKDMMLFGDKFLNKNDNKIALNFAAMNEHSIEPGIIFNYFDPEKYIIKITPLNPTYKAVKNNLTSFIENENDFEVKKLKDEFNQLGYEVILSIGENRENDLGSNCGQYVQAHLTNPLELQLGYNHIKKTEKYVL
jgi:23S rRNA (adenine2503-C2)-methyltransferase